MKIKKENAVLKMLAKLRPAAFLPLALCALCAISMAVSCGSPTGSGTEHNDPIGPVSYPDETNKDPGKWTVFFDSMGGSHVQAEAVTKGDRALMPTPPVRAGFTFGGWFTSEYCSDPLYEQWNQYEQGITSIEDLKWNFNSTAVDDNMTLYARWTGGEKWFVYDGMWRTWKYWMCIGQVIQLEPGTYDAGMVAFGDANLQNGVEEGWFGVFRYDANGMKVPYLDGALMNDFTYDNNGNIVTINSFRKYVTKPAAGESLYDLMGVADGYGLSDDGYGPVLMIPGGQDGLGGYQRGDTTFTVDKAGWYFVSYDAGLGYQDNGTGGMMLVYSMYIKKHGYSDNLLQHGDLWFQDQDDMEKYVLNFNPDTINYQFNNPDNWQSDFLVAPPVLTADGPNTQVYPGLAPGKWFLYACGQGSGYLPYYMKQWGEGWSFVETEFPKFGSTVDWPDKNYANWF
ncbi:MAG: InlB B-repeat-containing protein [Treponema sp.]|nr:InlB B-repeat-containing protein [Treponema sp.]